MSGGGGSTTTETEPGPLDFLNAEIVSTLAPYLMENVAADVGGAMTADKSTAIQQAINKGTMQGASPGTAQMFANINNAGQAGKSVGTGAMNTAMMLYGKQPGATPGGGATNTTPGIQDYTQALLNAYKVYNAYNTPTPPANYANVNPTAPTYNTGGGYLYTIPGQ